jgi:trehalose/maltose hydrolase-like predicted phosphorylase
MLETDRILALAAEAIWQGCGVSVRNSEIVVSPQWPPEWGWWALLNLPVMGETLSLLWDGETLHTTHPVRFDGNTAQHQRIQAEGSDTESFSLRFLLTTGNQTRTFRPIFYAEGSWPNRQVVHGVWLEQ